jgi:polyisoprenoid-binding protein YceI
MRSLIVPSLLALALLAAPAAAQTTYTLRGTEARYTVRELLAANTIENDVVGKTSAVTGQVVLDAKGAVNAAESKITVDLTGLKTDRERRDGYVQRNTLQTATYPTTTLVVRELRGLAFPLPTAGQVTFTLVGDLTLKDVTKPTTWTVTATASPAGLTGTAKTAFTFDVFGLTKPRVPVVARVDDPITLELDFTFAK